MPLKPPVAVKTPLSNKPYWFQPGNKVFKPKGIGELKQAARNMSLEMLNVMIRIALDDDERGSVRLAAADMVMTRGYGKPDSYHDTEEDKALTMKPADLTSEQIMAMLAVVDTVDPTDIEPPVHETLSLAHSKQIDDAQEQTS